MSCGKAATAGHCKAAEHAPMPIKCHWRERGKAGPQERGARTTRGPLRLVYRRLRRRRLERSEGAARRVDVSWLFRSFEVLSPLLFAEVPLYRMDLRRLALGAEGFAVGAHPIHRL